MTIGVDGNEANVERQVGVSVYTLKLLEYFNTMADADTRFNVFLREPRRRFLPRPSEHFTYTVIPARFFWSQVFLPIRLRNAKLDLFFSPAHYIPRFCPVPVVVSIHDLAYFYYPDEFLKKDLFKLISWTNYSVKKAKRIIAVSNNTKKDLVKFYEVPKEKVDVIYNGFEKDINPQANSLIIENLNLKAKNYILYVGTLQPRKNVSFLIRAFKIFIHENHNFKLVLVGKKGWLYEEIFEIVRKLHLENKVIFTGYLPDNDLIELYKNAFCFVMPSLYEGFCIPILEAMSFGMPVVAARTSSLPEIGGDACLYFNPEDEQDLVTILKNLQQDKSIRDELIRKGKERIKSFSWKKSGEHTLRILKTIYES